MEAFITLLVFAVFFYVMMRFGCGAHVVHGDQRDHNKKDNKSTAEKPNDRVDNRTAAANVLSHSSTARDIVNSQPPLDDGSRSDSHLV